MHYMTLKSLLAVTLVCLGFASQAEDFYYGASIGYGSLNEEALAVDTGTVASGIEPPEGLSIVGDPMVGFNSAVEDDKDINWKIFGGYNLTRNYAVEAGYMNFGKSVVTSNLTAEITTTLPDPLSGTQTSDAAINNVYSTSASGFHVEGLARYPFLDEFNMYDFSVYAKAGAIWWNSDIRLNQTSMPFNLQVEPDEEPPAGGTSMGSASGGNSGINFLFGVGADFRLTMDIGIRGEWSYYRGIDNRDISTFSLGMFYLFRL